MLNLKTKKGYSLVELLVVIGIFAVLATLASQAVVLTLRSTNKSESSIKVKENLNYALGVMERQIRNSTRIVSCVSNNITYKDSTDFQTTFQCSGSGTDFYVASGSGRLTSTDVNVSTCSITCNPSTPPFNSVTITLKGSGKASTGVENTSETVANTIYLRQGN